MSMSLCCSPLAHAHPHHTPMLDLLENFLMIGKPAEAANPVWALLVAALLVAATVLRRTPRN